MVLIFVSNPNLMLSTLFEQLNISIQHVVKYKTKIYFINIHSQITIADTEFNGKPFGAGKANHIFLKRIVYAEVFKSSLHITNLLAEQSKTQK